MKTTIVIQFKSIDGRQPNVEQFNDVKTYDMTDKFLVMNFEDMTRLINFDEIANFSILRLED